MLCVKGVAHQSQLMNNRPRVEDRVVVSACDIFSAQAHGMLEPPIGQQIRTQSSVVSRHLEGQHVSEQGVRIDTGIRCATDDKTKKHFGRRREVAQLANSSSAMQRLWGNVPASQHEVGVVYHCG